MLFFFFILALKVAWSERVDASYHSLTGFVSFFYHKRKKKKVPKSSFGRCHFSVVSEATHYRCTKRGKKKGVQKRAHFTPPAVPPRLVVLLLLSNELNVIFAV